MADWQYVVTKNEEGERLDLFLPRLNVSLSRSQGGKLITGGYVTVNGKKVKRGYRLREGDTIHAHLPAPQPPALTPEPMDLSIVYEDDHLIVLNKPAGIVVHPGAGHWEKTLVHGLLHHCENLQTVGDWVRPGIVHRLDKETSGLLVVAKSVEVHRRLTSFFKERKIEKGYLTFVYGDVKGKEGIIDAPIGRHPKERQIMSTQSHKPREAITEWRVKERFQMVTFLQVYLRTGRTHQIRVHLNAIGHPVVGDPIYGRRKGLRNQAESVLKKKQVPLPTRQLLHAFHLKFDHPATGQEMEFTSPMPADMESFYQALKKMHHV